MSRLIFILTVIFTLFMSTAASALCVNAPEANLRKGPGTKYAKTWEVFKFMPLKKMQQKGNWYKVKDLDGDVHWIYKKLVTGSFTCASAKKDSINIRRGPGTTYKKTAMARAMKYDAFKILKTKGKWVHVVDEFGSEGWVYKQLLWIQ